MRPYSGSLTLLTLLKKGSAMNTGVTTFTAHDIASVEARLDEISQKGIGYSRSYQDAGYKNRQW